MDPISALNLAKTITDLSKTVLGVAKEQKDLETKDKLSEVVDQLLDLRQKAIELEDENRELKEKLRFSSENFEFRAPFYYEKTKPNVPLCPKCLVEHKRAAPMDAPYQENPSSSRWRKCLVCHTITDEVKASPRQYSPPDDVGPWG